MPARTVAGRAGQPEVGDPHLAGAVEHHIGRLEIAMDDTPLVGRGQARRDLPRHLERALHREPADATQQRAELFAVDVLHREEGVAVHFVDVVDAADVGV